MNVLGRKIRWSATIDGLDDWLHDGWHFPESAHAFQSEWTIGLERAGPVPADVRDADAWPGQWDTRHVLVGSDELWVLEYESGVHVRIAEKNATLTLHGDPFEGWIALHAALTEAISASGLVRLHASAATRHDRTVVFIAPSGTGKSTTLLRTIEQGWSPIAEDGCWIDPTSARLFGFDRRLRLLPDAAVALGNVVGSVPTTVGPTGKIEVPFTDIGTHRHSGELTDVALLERRPGSPTEWEPLADATAVAALFQSAGMPSADSGRAALATAFASLVPRLRCWRLILGDSVPTMPKTDPEAGVR